ncbi:MAG: HDOD domain-containing protein [Reichenbachiella sp.]
MIVKIAIAGVNLKEVEVFKTVLEQRNFTVQLFKPDTGSYLEIMKYKPDAMLIEFPEYEVDQMHLIKLILGNKKLKKMGILCYGNHPLSQRAATYKKTGIKYYFQRPLKISEIFSAMTQVMGGEIEKLLTNEKTEEEKGDFDKELDALLLPSLTEAEKTDIMIKHIGKLMAFPYSIAKIVQLTGDDSSSANELANVIRSDASIATSVIKLSNSVIFSSLNREIKDVKDAIVRVGFNETKKVTLSLAVMQLLDDKEKNFGFSRHKFWYHSLTTALIAEKLAKSLNHPNPSLAFLCGLLHEYAVLLFDEFFGEVFEVLQEETFKKRCTFVESGDALLKVNQNTFMAELFNQWYMPRDLVVAIKEFNNFPKMNQGLDEHQQTLVLATGLADVLAKSICVGRSCDEVLYGVPDLILQKFRLGAGIKNIFFDTIYSQVNMFVQYLGLEKIDLPFQAFKPVDPEKPLKMVVVSNRRNLYDPHLLYLEHTGFELLKVLAPSDLEQCIEDVSLMVYTITDGDSFDRVKEYYDIAQIHSLNSLVFYADSKSMNSIPSMANIKSLSTSLDTRDINDALKELFKNSLIINSNLPFDAGVKVEEAQEAQ